jgi:hypothetical protein
VTAPPTHRRDTQVPRMWRLPNRTAAESAAMTTSTVRPADPVRDGEWRTRAACLDTDPELFFSVASSGRAAEVQEKAAKAVCRPCPVRDACLEFAMTALPFGVAGGLTEDERAARRRKRSAA